MGQHLKDLIPDFRICRGESWFIRNQSRANRLSALYWTVLFAREIMVTGLYVYRNIAPTLLFIPDPSVAKEFPPIHTDYLVAPW